MFCGLTKFMDAHLILVQHSARPFGRVRPATVAVQDNAGPTPGGMRAWSLKNLRLMGQRNRKTKRARHLRDGIPHDFAKSPRALTQMGARSRKAEANSSDCSLLLFVAVGDFDRAGKLLKFNLEHLHSSLKGYCKVDVYVNHYDGAKDYWKEHANKWGDGWYSRHVAYSSNTKGFKFQVMQELLRDMNIGSFTWVWAVDEDFNIANTDVKRFLQLSEHSGALISLPAFTQEGDTEEERELCYPMQAPRSDCLYRYTDVVEVIFPLFRPRALKQMLWHCDHCIGERTVWGLDRMWCGYTARQLARDPKKACAIVDATPMVHQNFKTLGSKYDETDDHNKDGFAKVMETEFDTEARDWMAAVEEKHRDVFVGGNSKLLESGKCVKD